MNYKDLDPIILQNLIDQIECHSPNLLQTLINQLIDQRNLCQQEQNLQADLSSAKSKLQILQTKLSNSIAHLHEQYDPEIDSVKGQIQTLESSLSKIHQDYISKYPSKPCSKPDIHTAFNILLNEYPIYCQCPKHNDLIKALYKRFDNLIHARCNSTSLFGSDWTINDVYNVLCELKYTTLAENILNFYQTKKAGITC